VGWVSAIAVFFVIWWTVLFAILPIGLRTQDDAGEVTLGTEASAPRGPHMLRVAVLTTLVSLAIFAVLFVLTHVLGYGFDDIPRLTPDFE
jgi:predicted secreted protein